VPKTFVVSNAGGFHEIITRSASQHSLHFKLGSDRSIG